MKNRNFGCGTFIAIIIILAIALVFLKTFWWILTGISFVLAGIAIYQRKKKAVELDQATNEKIEFTQTCPTCGAKNVIKDDASVAKCEYCGETFIVNEEIVKHFGKNAVKEKETPKELNLIPIAIAFFVLSIVGLYLNVTGFGESTENNTVINEQVLEEKQHGYIDTENQTDNSEIVMDAAKGTESEDTIPTTVPEVTQIDEKSEKTYAYDKLQTLFLNIDNTVTKEALVSMIQENGLEYTEVEYNKFYRYKAASRHEVALQSRGEEGDYVSVDFDKDTGEITEASYFNNSAWKECYTNGNRESVFKGTNTMKPSQWEGSDNLVQFIGEKDAPIEHGVAMTNKKWVYYDSLESMLHSIMDYA